jgi:hypothetical protein
MTGNRFRGLCREHALRQRVQQKRRAAGRGIGAGKNCRGALCAFASAPRYVEARGSRTSSLEKCHSHRVDIVLIRAIAAVDLIAPIPRTVAAAVRGTVSGLPAGHGKEHFRPARQRFGLCPLYI